MHLANQVEANFHQQQQQQQLSPDDKFFAILESNLEKYMNNRPEAYEFIKSQLKNYRGKYLTLKFSNSYILVEEVSDERLKTIADQNSILKKGVRIQNQKLMECQQKLQVNENKARNYDTLLEKYQQLEAENRKFQQVYSYYLGQQIGAPHTGNGLGGGHSGIDF